MAVRITGAKQAGRRVEQTLQNFAIRQAQFAARQAVNDSAYLCQQHINKTVIPSVFDRPTRPTLQATKYRKATKDKPIASVYIDDYSASDVLEGFPSPPGAIKRAQTRTTGKAKIPPVKWLYAEAYGGPRRVKAFEKLFREIGILPPGMFVVPASGTALDQSGNIPGSFINFIYNYFKTSKRYAGENEPTSEKRKLFYAGVRKAGGRVGKRLVARPGFDITAVKRVKGKSQFAQGVALGYRLKGGQIVGRLIVGGQGRGRHLKPGIYTSIGPGAGRLVAILKFVRQPSYRKQFPFHTAVENKFYEVFPKAFVQQWQRAILNAKSPGAPALPVNG